MKSCWENTGDVIQAQHHTYSNQLKLTCIPRPMLQSVSVSVAIGCGSRHESEQDWGLSHFVEHMLFRGSKHYPSSIQLLQAIEKHGGRIDASTWRDQTLFTITTSPQHLEESLFVLSDMLRFPLWKDIELERNIILEELNGELNEWGYDVDIHPLSRQAIWGPHPIARRILGDERHIRRFALRDLTQHHKRFYLANNLAIGIAGCFDSKALAWIERYFATFPAGPVLTYPPQKKPTFHTQAAQFYAPHPHQYTAQLSFKAPAETHPDFLTTLLLCRVLDDGLCGRWSQTLSLDEGLIYDLDSGLDCYQDCGTYDIQWTVAPERLMDVSEHIQKICQSIAEKGITEDEFEAAKTRELFEWRCNLDDSQSLAETLATYTLFGRQLGWSTHRQKVGEITLEHINHVAQKLFTKSPRQMSLMGADLKRYRIAQHGKITKLSAHVPLRLL